MTPRKEVIGDATLYLGDCIEILPTLGHVDAIVTDPPYGIGASMDVARHKFKTAKSGWDKAPPSKALFDTMLSMSTTQVIWGGNYFGLPPTQCFLVWDKVQPESFSLAMCEQAWTNLKRPAKMFRRRVVGYPKEHPTQKPDDLMEWCLGHLPQDARTVLDPFMGAGTTGVACAKTGRPFIGIEIDESYFDIARRRIEAAYAQPRLVA